LVFGIVRSTSGGSLFLALGSERTGSERDGGSKEAVGTELAVGQAVKRDKRIFKEMCMSDKEIK